MAFNSTNCCLGVTFNFFNFSYLTSRMAQCYLVDRVTVRMK